MARTLIGQFEEFVPVFVMALHVRHGAEANQV